jgi:hypothetical protein
MTLCYIFSLSSRVHQSPLLDLLPLVPEAKAKVIALHVLRAPFLPPISCNRTDSAG